MIGASRRVIQMPDHGVGINVPLYRGTLVSRPIPQILMVGLEGNTIRASSRRNTNRLIVRPRKFRYTEGTMLEYWALGYISLNYCF